jgi:hypothetical protein
MSALDKNETQLLAELQACPNCREELVAVMNTVRLTNQALRVVVPQEDFWPGYHDRLEQRLNFSNENKNASGFSAQWFSALTSSIRVPLPLAVAVVLLLAAMSAFSVSQYFREVAVPAISQYEEPDAVPLIRQEVVTRVVYVRRDRRRPTSGGTGPATEPEPAEKTVAGLSGFKPTSEVKLKIIKGSAVDEK